MSATPNPDNYTLGKGVLYFDRFDEAGNLTGERDLGNAPELQFNMSVEMLDHFSSRSGISSKDKQVTKMVTPTFSFTLDEFNEENMGMLFYGKAEEVVQAAVDYNVSALPIVVSKNLYYDLGKRNVGIWKVTVAYEAGKTAADIADGATITGTTGGVIDTWDVITTIGSTIYLKNKLGNGLALPAGDVFIGTDKIATYTAAPAFDAKTVLVKEGLVWKVPGADFSVDSVTGRILVGNSTTLVGAGVVYFANSESTYKKIKTLSNTALKGKIRFISDNPEGSEYSFQAWNCSLKPNGDTAFISDNWATVKFTCEILVDHVNHPDNPYMEIIIS